MAAPEQGTIVAEGAEAMPQGLHGCRLVILREHLVGIGASGLLKAMGHDTERPTTTTTTTTKHKTQP